MTLGPSGAAMLRSRKEVPETNATPSPVPADTTTLRMQSFFDAAMERSPGRGHESVGSAHSHLSEYDPDDLNVDVPACAAVAAADSSGAGTVSATRIRISAISDLKEFSGKDHDEDRARSWFSKVKSAFVRDQAPDSEKCLVFGDLLTGPARNWYQQLSRSTRSDWKGLANSFQIQYCREAILPCAEAIGRVAAVIPARRDHVDHFIKTLDDRDLASQLALLRIPDADTFEETLRSQERAKARQGKTVYGPIRPKPKAPAGAAPSANTRAVRTIRVAANPSESDSETSGSEGVGDLRKVYLAADADQSPRSEPDRDPRRPNAKPNTHREGHQSGQPSGDEPRKPRSQCGSTKHSDLGCWQCLAREKCGKKGHPTDRCLFTCKACGEIHGAGECPLEEVYYLIRQWYTPNKHVGILPQVSSLDAAFALKVGCYIDNSQELECEDVGKNPYMTNGRTRVKLTLAGSLVYYFDVWVGPPTGGQDLILGMDFMVHAGVRLDLADGALSLPDEIRIQLAGRRLLYGEKVSQVKLDDHCNLEGGGTFEIRKGFIRSAHQKLWVTRGERWVPSVVAGLGKTRYLKITNISYQKLVLQADTRIDMWLEGGRTSNARICAGGSRRYEEWQNLAFQVTTDQMSEEELHAEPDGPQVDRPLYETPLQILRRYAEATKPIVAQVSMAPPDEAKPEPRSELVGRAGGSDRPIAGGFASEASEDAHELNRFLENPGEKHWNAGIKVVKYLLKTKNIGILYDGASSSELVAYSDADWAGNRDDRRSVSDMMIMMCGAPVVWRSTFQKTVALSSTEAEYMPLSECVKEVVWMRLLLENLGSEQTGGTLVYVDNQGAMALAKNVGYQSRTKLIDIRYHFIREKVATGEVQLKYVESMNQLADFLTKGLSTKTLRYLLERSNVTGMLDKTAN
ncbi:unnamed protein product [Phytophthora fragariaefolia]|uniref:Unnamed protein product n=1 Tax=Phytophthora fragariaefolia TaxID=1490495 RepID=A0A9W6Y467_9STRA|nr:unnamed protein product [Phytophthora fragariaefolia]